MALFVMGELPIVIKGLGLAYLRHAWEPPRPAIPALFTTVGCVGGGVGFWVSGCGWGRRNCARFRNIDWVSSLLANPTGGQPRNTTHLCRQFSARVLLAFSSTRT